MFIWAGGVNVRGNTWQGNVSGWRGGAIYGESSGLYEGNIFRGNSATEQGGGLFSLQDIDAIYANNVWLGNHAAQGGGIYLWGSVSHFINNTIAGNSSTDGRGVVIDQYPGLVSPGTPATALANVAFTNTIISDQTTGIFATPGNTLTVNSILWYNTATHIDAGGTTLHVANEFSGNPRFEADGYHLQGESSAAVDRGVTSATNRDVDGQLRPSALAYDLGADEIMSQVHVTPGAPASFTYTDPQSSTIVTVTVPAQAFTTPVELRFTPFPEPVADLITLVQGDMLTFGLPFRLTPFVDGVAVPALIPSNPMTLTMTWGPSVPPANFNPETLNLFAISSYLIDGTNVYTRQPASCGGAPTPQIGGGVAVLLCGFGGTPADIVPRAGAEQFQTDALNADSSGFVYFWFMAEAKEPGKTYLPVVIKQ